ncbi:transposable element Tcb2 transposase [Trichonephila clavipes]|nr:transposable element Tcb2 transposase [Trichonephila clavipes]
MFSTVESRFSATRNSQRQLIQREVGTWFHIPFGSWEDTVVVDHCCKKVILPRWRLYRGAIEPDFVFMDDNARLNWSAGVQQLLESENITGMDWPAFYLNLIPIEHVWDA